MLIIGLVLSVFGIGFFCWVLFILAVYALPFVVGLTAGLAAYHSGAGIAGAIIVAIIAGGVTLTVGQIAFATIRSPLIRAAIGLIYAVPAAIAGYNGTLGFAQMGIPPKPGAWPSQSSGRSLSAARPGHGWRCSSHPRRGGALLEVRLPVG